MEELTKACRVCRVPGGSSVWWFSSSEASSDNPFDFLDWLTQRAGLGGEQGVKQQEASKGSEEVSSLPVQEGEEAQQESGETEGSGGDGETTTGEGGEGDAGGEKGAVAGGSEGEGVAGEENGAHGEGGGEVEAASAAVGAGAGEKEEGQEAKLAGGRLASKTAATKEAAGGWDSDAQSSGGGLESRPQGTTMGHQLKENAVRQTPEKERDVEQRPKIGTGPTADSDGTAGAVKAQEEAASGHAVQLPPRPVAREPEVSHPTGWRGAAKQDEGKLRAELKGLEAKEAKVVVQMYADRLQEAVDPLHP